MASNKGLYSDILDIDKFIRLNQLEECTDPVYVNKNSPTPRGILSYEIFGTSQEERRSRMAYIDLHGHYMHPLAALKLQSYSRTLSKILFSQARYIMKNGELIEDDENGRSGPEFLYEIWGKVAVKDKEGVTTKEIQKFFERTKNELFVTKWPVIPAYFRDINYSSGSFSKSSNKINNWYSSMISYTQTLMTFTDVFTHMGSITQSRVQTLLTDIYKNLMIDTVKGSPSKYGMMRRYMQGKSVNYSARMVISSPNLRKNSYKDVQIKYGYASIPLSYVISCFMPFVVFELKQYFDNEFLRGGKYQVINKSGEVEYVTFNESFDENHIQHMIARYINSPATRFDLVETPPTSNGSTYHMGLSGRFGKDDTTTTHRATVTDILYIAAYRAAKDKHVFVTRYPLDNFNGQWPGKVSIATTINTQPVTIGTEVFEFFPICVGDPANSFIDTLQFSNTYLKAMGGDLAKAI